MTAGGIPSDQNQSGFTPSSDAVKTQQDQNQESTKELFNDVITPRLFTKKELKDPNYLNKLKQVTLLQTKAKDDTTQLKAIRVDTDDHYSIHPIADSDIGRIRRVVSTQSKETTSFYSDGKITNVASADQSQPKKEWHGSFTAAEVKGLEPRHTFNKRSLFQQALDFFYSFIRGSEPLSINLTGEDPSLGRSLKNLWEQKKGEINNPTEEQEAAIWKEITATYPFTIPPEIFDYPKAICDVLFPQELYATPNVKITDEPNEILTIIPFKSLNMTRVLTLEDITTHEQAHITIALEIDADGAVKIEAKKGK